MIVDPMALDGFPALPTSTSASSTPSPTGAPIFHQPEIQEIGDTGKRTLWVVFVIMLVATITFSGLSFRVPIAKRLYHIITTLIVTIAALSYFAMAAGDGIGWNRIVVTHHYKHVGPLEEVIERQVFWARYVDWSLTTPLLLLDLALLAGLNGGHILLLIVADLIMILTGLFAAFGSEETAQKWGWYTIACIAYLVVVWHLVVHGRAQAAAKGGKVGGFYSAIGGFTLVLWTIYPIVWGLADGSRKASVDSEVVAYAVLDVLAKPVFGLWLLLTHANLPEASVELGGFWAHGLSSEGSLRVGDDDEGA